MYNQLVLVCKKLKSQFVSIKQIKGNGVLSQLFKNIPIA